MRINQYKIILYLFPMAFLNPTTMGCNKTAITDTYTLENIYVNKKSLELFVGDKEQLSAHAVPSVAHQPAFQWKSSDMNVGTVNMGIVEAINEGEAIISVLYQAVQVDIPVIVRKKGTKTFATLYDKQLNKKEISPEILINGAGDYTDEGLMLTENGKIGKLNKFYALAERMVRYKVRFSHDAKAVFRSSEGDFIVSLDLPEKQISIGTHPLTIRKMESLAGNKDYLIEIDHIYQQANVRLIDLETKDTVELSVINDGQGGCGAGALQSGFAVGMQWDHYCFGLESGTSMLIKQISVFSMKDHVKLLIYGDSITQPEGYFPTSDFPLSWTQLIINRLGGNAMSSGRGGGTIHMLLEYIKNELPFLNTEYVMVTIGTNGGNTAENLTELVKYIKSQGAIPILNNIPCNESGTQIENNKLIEKIRQEQKINGALFDITTSLSNDGQQVDKSFMYWEDYSGSFGWQIYHHPNEKGGKKMFERTLIDVPEIYN